MHGALSCMDPCRSRLSREGAARVGRMRGCTWRPPALLSRPSPSAHLAPALPARAGPSPSALIKLRYRKIRASSCSTCGAQEIPQGGCTVSCRNLGWLRSCHNGADRALEQAQRTWLIASLVAGTAAIELTILGTAAAPRSHAAGFPCRALSSAPGLRRHPPQCAATWQDRTQSAQLALCR